jgi:hypothetical protein
MYIYCTFRSSNNQVLVFWYSDYGAETDVSLNCGHFYGPIVRPRVRMNEISEWMKLVNE